MKGNVPLFTLLALLTVPAGARAVPAEEAHGTLSADTFRGLALRGIGPALMSARIGDIAIHPMDQSTGYVAAGSRGAWKTTNAGTTWTPIFDDQTSCSIGGITLDPVSRRMRLQPTGSILLRASQATGYGRGTAHR